MTLSLSAGLLIGMSASLILTPVGYVILDTLSNRKILKKPKARHNANPIQPLL